MLDSWIALYLFYLCYHCWVASLVPMIFRLAWAGTWWLKIGQGQGTGSEWYVSVKGTCQGHGEFMVNLWWIYGESMVNLWWIYGETVEIETMAWWGWKMCSSALVKNTNVIMYGFQRSMKGHCPTQCDSLGISKPKAPCTRRISDCVVDMVSRYDSRIWQEVTIGFLGSHGISQWLHPAQRTAAPRRFRTAMHRWIGTTRRVSHVAGRFLVMTSSS